MTHNLKTLQPATLALRNPRLAPGDFYLFFDRVHPVQIRQQKPSSITGDDDDAITLCVQLVDGIHAFGLAQHVHAVLHSFEFLRANRLKPRVLAAGGHRVFLNLLCNILRRGGYCPDATAQFPRDLEGNEDARLPQMMKQAEKLEDVIAIRRHHADHAVFSELEDFFRP